MKVILLIMAFSTIGYSQKITEPGPTIGWDSLQTIIEYPELAIRIGYNSALLAKIEIDSTGKVNNIKFSSFSEWIKINDKLYECKPNPMDSLIIDSIYAIVRKISWFPGTVDGKKTTMIIEIPFIFYLYNPDISIEKKIIIKKEPRYKIKKCNIH